MSKNLRRCIPGLQIVAKEKKNKLQKSLLKDISCQDCYFYAIHEIVWNIVNKKVKLNVNDKKRLKSHIKLIRKILECPKSQQRRALVVNQSGGFLNIAIPVVLSVLTEVFKNVIS